METGVGVVGGGDDAVAAEGVDHAVVGFVAVFAGGFVVGVDGGDEG